MRKDGKRSTAPTPAALLSAAALMALPSSPPADDEPWQSTHVVKTLWPPQAGTVKLRRRFGAELVCVRYRHDSSRCHRYTTVEIVVDHAPVKVHPKRRFVEVGLAENDHELRAAVRAWGARWDKRKGVWVMDRRVANRLGLGRAKLKG